MGGGHDKKDEMDGKDGGSAACLWEMEAIDGERRQSVEGSGWVSCCVTPKWQPEKLGNSAAAS